MLQVRMKILRPLTSLCYIVCAIGRHDSPTGICVFSIAVSNLPEMLPLRLIDTLF